MPLPEPTKGESRDHWQNRCMAHPAMVGEYTESGQRFAVCTSIWGQRMNAPPKDSPIALFCQGGDAVAMGPGETVEGVHIRRYKKDMISVGQYTHPTEGWKLQVTPERLAKWNAAHGQMVGNGVDVEVVIDHSLSAEAIRGSVTQTWIEPNDKGKPTLFGIHEMRGAAGISLAERCKGISVLIDPHAKDGEGREYGEAITHSSICQQPIVPGQKAFVPIAASRVDGFRGAPLYLSDSLETEPMTDEQTKALRELIGAGEDFTPDTATDLLTTYCKAQDAKVAELQLKIVSLEAGQDKDKDDKPVIDPELLDERRENAEEKIEALVAANRLSPAAAKELKPLLLGSAEAPSVIMLSRSATKSAVAPTKAILLALAKNDRPAVGARTGIQAPGAPQNEAEKVASDELLDEFAKAAMAAGGIKPAVKMT